MKKIILILALLLCLVGCGNNQHVEAIETMQEPFECVYAKGNINVFVDRKTNVMY